jgi:hypothetical protein
MISIDGMAGSAGTVVHALAQAGVRVPESTAAAATTNRVLDALAEGRLLRTRDDAAVAHIESILREGPIDEQSRRPAGYGMNGTIERVEIGDPVDPSAPATVAIEKPAGAQAAQEELGWRLARVIGIDHLFPAVARRADGTARIEFRAGRGLSLAGVTDVASLERELQDHYLRDASLGLTKDEAAHAARIDRQLLQAFDYLLANNDRRTSNGLVDAVQGVTFIDAGHAGRGTLAQNGGTVLEPSLQLFQAGRDGGRVDLDPDVVAYLRGRVSPSDLRAIHADVFDAPGIAGPAPRSIGERFIGHVASTGFRDGMVQRLDHLVTTGGYTHRPYAGDAGGELPPLLEDRMRTARGFGGVRAAMQGGGMF